MNAQGNILSPLYTMRIVFVFSVLLALFASGCITSPTSQQLYSSNYLKGMNIFFMNSRNCYRPVEFENALNELLLAGVNTVFIVTFHYAENDASDSIFGTSETVPDSTLCEIIEHTRAKGIEPILKPHIDLLNGIPRVSVRPRYEIMCS